MNKAVVEFYKSGQTTTGTLKQTLMAMKNQVFAVGCIILILLVHVKSIFSKSFNIKVKKRVTLRVKMTEKILFYDILISRKQRTFSGHLAFTNVLTFRFSFTA